MIETSPLDQFFGLMERLGVFAGPFFISIALIIGAVIAGGRNPRQAKWGMHALRIILDSFAGLFVLLCLLDAVRAVGLIYGHDAASSSLGYGAMAQAVMARLLSFFIYHPVFMALASIFVLVPSTRTHPDIVRAAALFMVAISLPIAIIQYCALSWWPGADFRFYVRYLVPPLACVLAAAAWFGIKVGLALRHKRDARAWTIGGLAVFHLACVCIYTFLVYVLVVRMAVGGMGQ